MSILDDAIREHLELKRAHGADEAEVKKLEGEAFGPPQRPGEGDSMAEAPTEFLTAPSEVVEQAAQELEGGARREPNIADLQEGPPPQEPSVEEEPAGEHELPVVDEPTPDGVHTTEEREAIADQPTEMFDVEAELVASAEAESPSDEQLLDAELTEPRLAPVDPLSGIEASAAAHEDDEDEDDEDFFSEQRLSDELNQALEAPVTDEHSLPPLPAEPTEEHAAPEPAAEDPHTEEGTALFDVEAEDDDYEDSAEFEAVEPEAGQVAEPESGEHEAAPANPYDPETGSHDDVLEDTPDFLEDAPEDENAWFEQRPPKDFDFDD
jgi:hypothetical protein